MFKSRMLSSVAGAVALVALSTNAHAADMYTSVSDWPGFYGGIFGGVSYYDPIFGDPENNHEGQEIASTFNGLAGGALGMNFQNGSFVYGLEGSFAGVFGDGAEGGTGVCSNAACNGEYAYRSENNWNSNILGRAGIDVSGTLLYVTAGLAFAEFNHTYYDSANFGTNTDVYLGLSVGGGFEHMVSDNISIDGRILYSCTKRKPCSRRRFPKITP